MPDGLGSKGVGCMTEYEQQLYDVVADWWDEVFARPRKLDKNDTIVDLVKSIMALQALDKLYQENNSGMKELANE